MPALAGVVVEAKPACRPKELLVAIKEPDKQSQQGEILLKFEKPLTGKPEVPADIQFEGVPSAFSASPFLLTMDADPAKLTGLKITPCAAKRMTVEQSFAGCFLPCRFNQRTRRTAAPHQWKKEVLDVLASSPASPFHPPSPSLRS